MSTERRLVLSAGSVELRRRLDPTAWVVFEQLLLESTDCGDVCRASVSVRSLAAQLGVAKDTVARALTRLRRAGLVDGSQSRTATGVYETGTYTLTIPTSISLDDHTPPQTLSTTPTATPAPHPTRTNRDHHPTLPPPHPLTTPPTMNTFPTTTTPPQHRQAVSAPPLAASNQSPVRSLCSTTPSRVTF